jgi:hypothetical protein
MDTALIKCVVQGVLQAYTRSWLRCYVPAKGSRSCCCSAIRGAGGLHVMLAHVRGGIKPPHPPFTPLQSRKPIHSYRAASRGRSDCFFVRNTGRTDDAVVIMVIMMQQHTNIYKHHLVARLTASSGRDYVTHCPLVGHGVAFRRTMLHSLLFSFRSPSVMKQYGHVVTSRFQLTADCRSACLLCITSPCSHAVVTLR